MKKYLLILLVFLSACESESGSKEEILAKIESRKGKIVALQEEIEVLTGQLCIDTVATVESVDNLIVKIQEIQSEKFAHYFEATASLEAVKSAYVSPEMSGQIKQILVKEGNFVKKGQLLISLNSSALSAQLAGLKTQLELATTMYEKQKELWDKKIGTEVQYLQAKTNKEGLDNQISAVNAQIEMTKVRAPFSGIVDAIHLKIGELVAPGRQVIELINLSEMYINADISERYLANVKEGDAVVASFPMYPDMKLETRVFRIGNTINPANRTFRLRLKINNIDNKLKPNIVATIKLNDYSSDSAIVIPSMAIKQDINGYYIFTVENKKGKSTARKKYVVPGMNEGEKTMITSGLGHGDKVIVEGYNLVRDGQFVSVQ